MKFKNLFYPEQLKRNSTEPLYLQVRSLLRSYIETPQGKKVGHLPKEKDLSKYFGVSRNTVSQAISLLAEENLVQRIKRRGTVITSSLDLYDPSLAIRQIGLVLPFGEYWSKAISEMEKNVTDHGYFFQAYPYKWRDLQDEKRVLKKAQAECNGVVLYPNGESSDHDLIQEIDATNYPLVLFDLHNNRIDCNAVTVNNFLGAYLLTCSILKAGRKNPVFFTLHKRVFSMTERLLGFKQALEDFDIEFNDEMVLNFENYGEEANYINDVQRHIMTFVRKNDPDGIFVSSHDFAMVTLQTLINASYKIPQDIQIVKFDSSPEDDLINYNINTASQPEDELGKEVIHCLLKSIKYPGRKKRKILLSPKIIIRYKKQ